MVIDDVFAVIAEGTRREILGSLRSGGKAVGELVEELAVSQPTVSKHLKVLREAGLVSMRAQGQKRFYTLQKEPLREIALWLSGFETVETIPGAVGAQLAAVTELTDIERDTVVPPRPAPSEPVLQQGTIVPAGQDQKMPQQLGRTVGRTVGQAAEKAADLLAHLPKFGRRKE